MRRPQVDHTQVRYQYVTAIEPVKSIRRGTVWRWKCNFNGLGCKGEFLAVGSDVATGRQQTCGCLKRPDYTNMTFGNVQFVKFIKKSARGDCIWELRCLNNGFNCKGTFQTRATHVLMGETKNCGCFIAGDPNRCGDCDCILTDENRSTARNFIMCKPCYKVYKRNKTLKKNYKRIDGKKFSLADFNNLLIVQNNRCAICNHLSDKLNVDHCHATGEVRGLLCHHCNSLGLAWYEFYRERIEIIPIFERYLNHPPIRLLQVDAPLDLDYSSLSIE